jgi:hypothetical protein
VIVKVIVQVPRRGSRYNSAEVQSRCRAGSEVQKCRGRAQEVQKKGRRSAEVKLVVQRWSRGQSTRYRVGAGAGAREVVQT